MSKFRYMSEYFSLTDTNHVARGHNKKFIINVNNDTYFFKYDAEKETKGNMQKRFASGFCSFLTNKYGGNFVDDIPGEAIVETVPKEHSLTTLKGVYSKSYKEDYHIGLTFTLDEVLKPREDEDFTYNNENRVFASVENSMSRLKSYIEMQKNKELDKAPFSLFHSLNNLEEDYLKIQNDLVEIVLLDYLFLNNDRHTENIEFTIKFDDSGDYHLVVSPVFDNDRSFGLDKDEKKIIEDCSSKILRDVYVDYGADIKYAIRNKDCEKEFASEMNFSNNYHADVIADYIRQNCLDENGLVDEIVVKEHPVYKLYNAYKDVNITSEFFEFLSEVADINNVYYKGISVEESQDFVDEFNKKTHSTLSVNHIKEVTQNFNIRQSLLNNSIKRKLPEINMIESNLVK